MSFIQPLLAQNGSGLSFLIYLLIGIFWLAGNLMQQKEAKRKAEAMRKRRLEREEEEKRTGKRAPSRQEDVLETQLETLLGRFAGEEAESRQPDPLFQPENEIRFDQPPSPPPPKPVPPPEAAAPAPAPAPKDTGRKRTAARSIDDLNYGDSFKQIEDLRDLEELDLQKASSEMRNQVLKQVQSMKVDLSATNFSMLTLPMQSMRATPSKTSKPNLRKGDSFKRGVVASVILQPPKALQSEPFDGLS